MKYDYIIIYTGRDDWLVKMNAAGASWKRAR